MSEKFVATAIVAIFVIIKHMKTKFLVAASMLLLSVTACKKSTNSSKNVNPDPLTGTITVFNNTNAPYGVSINAASQNIITAHDSARYTVVFGHYVVEAVSKDGYGKRFTTSGYVTTTSDFYVAIDE